MPSDPSVITDKQGNHCISASRLIYYLISAVMLIGADYRYVQAQTSSGKKFTVTIDAGHGGHDTGAPGKKSVEKNIALGIALKLGSSIESMMDDVNVFYTRKSDVFVPLYERAQIANKNKSDLFISIHVNAVRPVKNRISPSGTSTYVMGFSRSAENLDLVKQENKAILLEDDYKTKYAGFDPTSDESYIMFNNFQNNNLTQSLELATAVQDQLRTVGKRKDIGVHQGNLVVLWGCAKPSVLIETGFISNPQEEAFLMSEAGQDIIASSIYRAFREYKESVDARVNGLARSTAADPETDKNTDVTVKKTDETGLTAAIESKKSVVSDEKKEEAEKKTIEEEKKMADRDTVPGLADTGMEYRIQVLASVKKLLPDARDFKGVKGLDEIKVDGYYKYMSQPVKTYPEALELKGKLSVSFREAFIVAFKDGVRVPIQSKIEKRKN